MTKWAYPVGILAILILTSALAVAAFVDDKAPVYVAIVAWAVILLVVAGLQSEEEAD